MNFLFETGLRHTPLVVNLIYRLRRTKWMLLRVGPFYILKTILK
jgi:hypothetical protein